MFKFFRRIIFWAFIAMLIWVFLGRNDARRTPAPQPSDPAETSENLLPVVPPARPEFDPERLADHVFVDKSERVLRLLADGYWLAEYEIALGFAPEGNKEFEGDGKTPTGEYLLDWRNENSQFYRSIHISYPRADQVVRAKAKGRSAGGAIMIHGQPNGSPYTGDRKITGDWTNGCISVSNNEMDEIWARVRDGTPITIID